MAYKPNPAPWLLPLSDAEKATLAERIRLNSVAADNGCWLWQRPLDRDGYGKLGFRGNSRMAHRVSYMTFVGPWGPGLELDHLCRVRSCVNPAHLEPVTAAENYRRGAKSGVSHCGLGHEFTPENTYHWRGKHKHCRTCRRVSDDGSTKRKRKHPPWTETHCPRGHELTSSNFRLRRGQRVCLDCARWLASRRAAELASGPGHEDSQDVSVGHVSTSPSNERDLHGLPIGDKQIVDGGLQGASS